MTTVSPAHATMDAARLPRAAKSRWLAGLLLLVVLLLTMAWALRDVSGGNRTAGPAMGTTTHLLPQAQWGFGVNDHATTSYALPIRSGDAVNVTQRDAKGNVVWHDRFVFRNGPNGWGFKRPVARFAGKGARVRNVAIVCDGPLIWGSSVDPVRQLRLEVPARRVRLGLFGRETPRGTVEVK